MFPCNFVFFTKAGRLKPNVLPVNFLTSLIHSVVSLKTIYVNLKAVTIKSMFHKDRTIRCFWRSKGDAFEQKTVVKSEQGGIFKLRRALFLFWDRQLVETTKKKFIILHLRLQHFKLFFVKHGFSKQQAT